MKIFIRRTDITDEILQCKNTDEVAILYEAVKQNTPLMDESIEHRNYMNDLLLTNMLKLYQFKSKAIGKSFKYA